ncbi:MAG TPA: hypothetical protein VII92_03310 [Anaerolineae bacterium]
MTITIISAIIYALFGSFFGIGGALIGGVIGASIGLLTEGLCTNAAHTDDQAGTR